MRKIHEVIRLYSECNLSMRQIAKTVNVSRPKVSEIISEFTQTHLSYQEIKDKSDSELQPFFSKKIEHDTKANSLLLKFPEYAKELKKTGVTKQLLWEEYFKEFPDGLKYSRFCHHFYQWAKDEKLSLHINHKVGDKMFVDYAGKKMEILDIVSGEKIAYEIFVAILPSSQLTYVEASISQKQEEFMRSTERAIHYFGGTPSAIVPDNLKSGVITPDIYEPEINPLFADFSEYYRMAVVPARSRRPKDKAHVENAVKIIYRRIFAPLRKKTFYSLQELNKAIQNKLVEHNNTKLTKMAVTRRELFEEVEKNELKPLPIYPYPLKYFQNSRVAFNYHIELKEDKHYYSVPYLLRGKQVRIIYDERNVAIYNDNVRIVQHRRSRIAHKYTTVKDHMPVNHRFSENWNPSKLKWWAGKIGDDVLRVITHILESKSYPEQAYKSCMGILNQAKKHGNDTLNIACRKAWNMERVNYVFIRDEITKIVELNYIEIDEKQLILLPETHKNIRGKEYYK